MRLADLLVLALVTTVIASEIGRGIDGPLWPSAFATVGAVAWLLAGRRKVESAPDPVPPRPVVLIPTYNNIGSVADVARRAATHGLPVYVVDDGSTDGSGPAARAAGALVVTHPRNRGKGAALLTGMRAAAHAGYTHVICLDADGQHDPADVPAFAAAIEAEPIACFAGVRDLSTAPGISRFGRRFSNFWILVETSWAVADSQCGFRAYPIAPVLALGLDGGRYEMEVEVLTRLLWEGVPVRDLPCRVYYPPKAERVTSFRPFFDNARITWVNILLIAERIAWPPRWFLRIRGTSSWSGRSLGTDAGWRFVLGLLRVFGRRPAYAFTTLLAAWYLLFARPHREGLASYVARTRTSTFRIFRSFAVALVDRLAFVRQGPSGFTYAFDDVHHIQEAFDGRKGAILLSAHIGNIDVAAAFPGSETRIRRLHVLRFEAAGDHGRGLVRQMSPAWQPNFIAVNRAEGFSTLTVLRALREGAVIAMHGDRLIDDRFVTVDFLGAPARFPAGPWLLAAIAHVPVVIAGCFKEGPDGYRVIAMPARTCTFDRSRPRDAQIQEWAQDYANELGRLLERYPDQYYNFHDVWKA